jgi:hypothetical protein
LWHVNSALQRQPCRLDEKQESRRQRQAGTSPTSDLCQVEQSRDISDRPGPRRIATNSSASVGTTKAYTCSQTTRPPNRRTRGGEPVLFQDPTSVTLEKLRRRRVRQSDRLAHGAVDATTQPTRLPLQRRKPAPISGAVSSLSPAEAAGAGFRGPRYGRIH